MELGSLRALLTLQTQKVCPCGNRTLILSTGWRLSLLIIEMGIHRCQCRHPPVSLRPVPSPPPGCPERGYHHTCSFNCPTQNPPMGVLTVQRCPWTLSLVSMPLPNLTPTCFSPTSLPRLQGPPVYCHTLLAPSHLRSVQTPPARPGKTCLPSAPIIPPSTPTHTHTHTHPHTHTHTHSHTHTHPSSLHPKLSPSGRQSDRPPTLPAGEAASHCTLAALPSV